MRYAKTPYTRIPALSIALLLAGCGFVQFEGREKLPKPTLSANIEELNEEEAPYYNYRSETFHRKDPKYIGKITLRPAPGSELEGVKMELRKIPKGYAAETRLFGDDKVQGNFTLSKEKESKFVAGFYFKVKF